MEDDPIEAEQLEVLETLLGRRLTQSEFQGFLIVGNRFVDRFGHSRIGELGRVFYTDSPHGRRALAASLARVAATLGSYEQFANAFPVTIIPPLPAYPLLPIVGIETLQPIVYRVLGRGNREVDHIRATGHLSMRSQPSEAVLRTTPRGHWCAYEKWATPEETSRALQILPEWRDCSVRATIRTTSIADSAFVAYSVDPNDPGTKGLTFHGYFFEGVTQDHDEAPYILPGTAVQICVYGAPRVESLEDWDDRLEVWQTRPLPTSTAASKPADDDAASPAHTHRPA